MGPFATALIFAALGSSSGAPSDDDGPLDPFATIPVEAQRSPEPPPPPPPPAPPPRARAAVRAQLLDPFVGPRVPGTRAVSSDLKDPFAVPEGHGAPVRPIRDLRDPFVPGPGGLRPGECVTPGGVPVQRPKAMPPSGKACPGRDAPLLNPFAAA